MAAGWPKSGEWFHSICWMILETLNFEEMLYSLYTALSFT